MIKVTEVVKIDSSKPHRSNGKQGYFTSEESINKEQYQQFMESLIITDKTHNKLVFYYGTKEKDMKYVITIEFKEAYKKIVDYLLKRFLESNYFYKTKVDEQD